MARRQAISAQIPAPRDARDFPMRCVHELVDPSAVPAGARALDVGCSVGRSSFELGRFCAEVLGIDLSESFILAARSLQQEGVLPFEILTEGDTL